MTPPTSSEHNIYVRHVCREVQTRVCVSHGYRAIHAKVYHEFLEEASLGRK